MSLTIVTNRQGIALVIVIWVLALLSTIAAELAFSMRTEVNIVRNFKDATQAHYIARAGLNQSILALIQQNIHMPSDHRKQGDPSLQLRINSLNPPQLFAKGQFTVHLDNASGRVDLNSAGPSLLGILLSGLNIEDQEKATIIDSILDWRDSDNYHRLQGAENGYYQSLEPPYTCKNDYFSTKTELRLVKGIRPEIYEAIAPMIMVIPQRTRGGSGFDPAEEEESMNFGALTSKININAAPPQLLAKLPRLEGAQVELIQQYRLRADFFSLDEVKALLGADTLTAIAPFITTALSSYYMIRVEGRVEKSPGTQSINALVKFDHSYKKGYGILRMEESLF